MNAPHDMRQFHLSPTVMISSNNPDMTQEKAVQQFEEMKALTRLGQYEFVETRHLPDGIVVHSYLFHLSDGSTMGWGSNVPIEDSELAK